MRDYQQLKQKVSELQQCVAVANRKLSEAKIEYKRRLSEQKQLLKQLQMKHAKPISELASLQDEIERLQKQHHKEMLTLEHDNRHLGKQLAVQTEYSVQLQRQLDEQLLQLKSAQREVEDLHSLVEQMKPLTASSFSRQGAKPVSAHGSKKTDTKRSVQ
jgi:antitoxin component of MazEF toxin-antitoxin module